MRTKSQKEKTAFEREIVSLKASNDSTPNKKIDELRKQTTDLETKLDREMKQCAELTAKYEHLEEEHILTKAQLTTDKEGLQANLATLKKKVTNLENENGRFKKDNIDLSRKIVDMQNKCKDLESRQIRTSNMEHENMRLTSTVQQRDQEYNKLLNENDMNKEVGVQLRREVSIRTNGHCVKF